MVDSKFIEEEKYLATVNKLIKNDIENTSLAHQKKSKEKLSFEDRQRGQHLLNNSMLNIMHNRIRILKTIAPSPYFGRIDFKETNHNYPEKYYIGKANVWDDQYKLYVIDWRTPVAGMYYDNSIGKASYIAPEGEISGIIELKRQLIIENFVLKKALDVDLVGRDVILQEYLDVHANNRMNSIVASIQKQQNQIIRYNSRDNLIVQGIAGSGKTSVALHRIAYLMYLFNTTNNILVNSKQFMIIGPNPYFLNYISSVLPDLDVENAVQITLNDLVKKATSEKITVADPSKELQEYLNNDIKDDIIIENSFGFEKALDMYVNELMDYYLNSDIKYLNKVIFTKDYIASFLTGKNVKLLDNIASIQKRLISNVKNDIKSDFGKLEDFLTKEISCQIKELPQESKERISLFEKRDKIIEELKTGLADVIKEHFSLASKTVLQHYIRFITNIEKYLDLPGILKFKNETLKRLGKKNLSREDIGPMILLKSKLSSVSQYKDIIHIIIDEAQDLNLIEFKAIKNTFPNANFSIFGDLNQSIYSYRAVKDWDSVKTKVFDNKCQLFELNQSYRTTHEIMQEANKISKYLTGNISEEIVRHGDKVDYIKLSEDETVLHVKALIEENLAAGYKSMAIITKTEAEALRINRRLKDMGIVVPNITFEDKNYNGGICTIASSLVKGLEFDATILLDVNKENYKIEKDIDMKLLYVAMTRALHKTSIFYTNELPSILK